MLAPVQETVRWRGLRRPAGPERRRWPEEQKRALGAASLAPGAAIGGAARRADGGAGRVYRGRKKSGAIANGSAAVLIASSDPAAAAADNPACDEPAIAVECAGKVRVWIAASMPADLAAGVLKALARR